MAAEFLVKLYEYSPLFYISVISVCFLITVAAVLGWFGFDVPVILRSSDEEESSPAPDRRMVQVINPFALEMGTGAHSVTDGVSLQPYCLEECVLSCFWGCSVQTLQVALQLHKQGPRLDTPLLFRDTLRSQYYHCQTFTIQKEERVEHLTQLPADLKLTDFGPLPRDRYPLVAVLTLANPEDRHSYNIVSSISVIHVPDEKYRLSGRILFQYVLTAQGNMFDLKPLFMSTESGSLPSGPTDEEEPKSKATEEEQEEWPGASGKDCVVCQNAAVNRVLLPCRHACVCDGCVSHFQHCPICRAYVLESFALSSRLPSVEGE